MECDRDRPAAGDLVIAPHSAAKRGYTLAVAPDGPSQLWYASYEQALKVAFDWSSASKVGVWRACGDAQFERVTPRQIDSGTRHLP